MPAVHCGDRSASYEEIYVSSNKLANCLKRNGVQRGDRVALILPKSIEFIYSMLGILKADAIYVPIDAQAPPARVAEIIEDCDPSSVICDDSTALLAAGCLHGLKRSSVIFVLGEKTSDVHELGSPFVCQNDIEKEDSTEPNYANLDRDIAYIIYTSGSTGKPKGVMVSHLSVLDYINWAVEYFSISHRDHILNTSPLHFDMSVFDLYCPLMTGGSLTLVPKQLQLFPIRLLEIMEKRRITIWKTVSSLLAYFVKARALSPGRLDDVRTIIFSGENLPTKYLIEWMRTYPDKEFYNAYGPTEATGISTCYRVEDIPSSPDIAIPIGKACTNTEVFALKENGTILEANEIGELYIRGSCLSLGYWNNPVGTESAFGQNPLNNNCDEMVYRTGDLVRLLPDGNYVHLGRKDDQIKYMGHRIELGEIECSRRCDQYGGAGIPRNHRIC
jgi:amino acid adenylation domain-containing protein